MGGSAESTDSENDRKEKSENPYMLACIATLTNGKSYPLWREQKCFIRFRSLGEDFTEENLKKSDCRRERASRKK